jgi:hypothetical protein
MIRTRVGSGPPPDLDQGLGILCPGILGPCGEWPGPCIGGSEDLSQGSGHARGGFGPYPEVRFVRKGVRHFPMGVQTHRR